MKAVNDNPGPPLVDADDELQMAGLGVVIVGLVCALAFAGLIWLALVA